MPVYKREGVEAAIRKNRQRARYERDRHLDVLRFCGHYAPGLAVKLRGCREAWKTYESVERPGYYKVTPYACHQVPWCIACTQVHEYQRTRQALDRLWRCTPGGEAPRLMHIVQTAPLTEEMEGWGWQASRDPALFSKIVYDTLAEFFGDGIGAVLSYQDFGEQGFQKRHPHIDLTLSGWRLDDDKAVKVKSIDLKAAGYAKWQQAVQGRAAVFDLQAWPGNTNFGRWKTGTSYQRILKYQLRELVDLRKMRYDPGRGLVYWTNYKNNVQTRMRVADFKAGLEEYGWRLGQWRHDGEERRSLHHWYGHLSDRNRNRTQRLVGGKPYPHAKNCTCTECGEWQRVFLADEEEDREALLSGAPK